MSLVAGCLGDGSGQYAELADNTMSMCWPEEDQDMPGPRPAGTAQFSSEYWPTTVEFKATGFLSAATITLDGDAGKGLAYAGADVTALTYFEGDQELPYNVRDSEGKVVESGVITVTNECPPPDDGGEPPPPATVTTLFDTCATDPRAFCDVDPDVFPSTEDGSLLFADWGGEYPPPQGVPPGTPGPFHEGGLCDQRPDGDHVTGEGLPVDISCVAVLTQPGTEALILQGGPSGLGMQQVVPSNPDFLGMILFLEDGTITDIHRIAGNAALYANATYGTVTKFGWDQGTMFWGSHGQGTIPGVRSADLNTHGFCAVADRASGGALYHGMTLDTMVEVAPCNEDPAFVRCTDDWIATTCHGDNTCCVYDAGDPGGVPRIVIPTGPGPWRLDAKRLPDGATGIAICNFLGSSLTVVRLEAGEEPKVADQPLGFDGPVDVILDPASLKAKVLVNGAKKVVEVSLASALGPP